MFFHVMIWSFLFSLTMSNIQCVSSLLPTFMIRHGSRLLGKSSLSSSSLSLVSNRRLKSSLHAITSVGIDLGTTYSAISTLEDGKPKIISIDGHRVIPSIVSYSLDQKRIVGHAAKTILVDNALKSNTFSSIKCLMGVMFDDAQRILQQRQVSFDIVRDKISNSTMLACPVVPSGCISPIEISADIIKYLLYHANAYNQQKYGKIDSLIPPISNAVVTVPAYFLPDQCRATEQAAKLAGLTKVEILREPEAVALAYGLARKLKPQIVLVFDLGGGTLDVSILEVGQGMIEVIATSGDANLGGDDFTEVVVQWILSGIETKYGAATAKLVKTNKTTLATLVNVANSVRVNLTDHQETSVAVPIVVNNKIVVFEDLLTRKLYEKLCVNAGLVQRMLRPLREAAIMAGVNLPGESGSIGINDASYPYNQNKEYFGEPKREARGVTYGIADSEHEVTTADQTLLRSLRNSHQQQQKNNRKTKTLDINKNNMGRELSALRAKSGDQSIGLFPGGQAIHEILLVGGASRMPIVHRFLHAIAGGQLPLRDVVHPDEAVSLGAAVMAGILDGEVKDMRIVSSWQASLLRLLHLKQQLKQRVMKLDN